MSDAPQFAVIGCGRSGTGYVAALLHGNGLKVGHEQWWGPYAGEREPGLQGDVSWLALPEIEAKLWEGPTVLVTRDPVKVIRSLLGTGFFGDPDSDHPHVMFAYANMPELRSLSPLLAAVEWWVRWNRRCAKVSTLKLRVEDLTEEWAVNELAYEIGHDLAPMTRLPKDVNTRGATPEVDTGLVRSLLAGRQTEFGYSEYVY